jgi:DNA invertase Pin-like site-specific DNA recombinase
MTKQIDVLLTTTSSQTAYLYLRYSTDDQGSGDSARRQLSLGTEYAAKNGLNLKTGKLGQFMKKLTGGEIKPGTLLLVEDIDRLSRQTPVDAIAQFYDLLQKGVKIVTLRDGRIFEKSTTDLGSLITSFVTMSRANEESKIKSMRLSLAWKIKREIAQKKSFQDSVRNGLRQTLA